MKYLKGFYMSLGMFSRIPQPFPFWDEKYTALMVAALPLVGAVIGGLWWLVAMLLTAIGLPLMLAAALLTLAPFFIAGFIHLDGYMDTSDALLSYRPLEDRLRILKDPNVGAFSVVMLGALFLLQFAAVYSLMESGSFFALLITISVISRCCSALSILVLRHMPQSNYAAMLSQNKSATQVVFIIVIALAAAGLSYLYAGIIGLIAVAAVALGYSAAMAVVYKNFKGISGDLLGYSMVIAELCGLIAVAGAAYGA